MDRTAFVKRLMGRPGRLDVAAWILSQPKAQWFTQRDATLGTGLVQSEARDNLEDFAELGMVERRENRWPHYRLVESPVWEALGSLAKAGRAIEAGKAAPRLDRAAKSRGG